jgi:hypothetical protein
MASNLEESEILKEAIAGIPKVAQAIAALPAAKRSKAFDAARQSYLQTLHDLGHTEAASQDWVATVMFQLRLEERKERLTGQRRLK